jgi:hypothetical protein
VPAQGQSKAERSGESGAAGSIDEGDDSGDFALDGECDGPRFDGPGSAALLVPEDMGADADDCRRLCAFGVAALRDYRAY